jgi:hypothetical protein
MSESRWRRYAAPIIARVLKETEGQEERVIRRALRAAYPFGERAMHPYKVWLDEIKKQRRRLRTPAECPPVAGGLFEEEG